MQDKKPGERTTFLLAVLILVFAPISFAYNGWISNARPSVKNDFTSYYVAGVAVKEGRADALYYPDPVGSLLAQASREHPWIEFAQASGIENPNYYLYPPLFAVLFAPLTLLPYKVAYVLWIGLSGLFLAGSVRFLIRLLGPKLRWRDGTTGTLAASAIVLMACLFYPVSRSLAVGQTSLLVLFLMAGTVTLLPRNTRNTDAMAGSALAFGIMLKLTPGILVAWLVLRRRWRALAFTCAAFALLAVVSVAVVGVEPHRVYVQEMVGQLSGGTAFYPNQSFAGVMARATGGDLSLADVVDAGRFPVQVARAAGFLLVALSFWVIWRRRGTRPDQELSLLLLASLPVSPISWEHHYVLALIPAAVLVKDAALGRLDTRRCLLGGISLALIGSYIGLRVIRTFGTGIPAQIVSSAALIGGLVLWYLMSRPEEENRRTGQPFRVVAPVLLIIVVFASGNFLAKLFEYNRSYQYGDFTSYYVAAATLVEGEERPLYYPDTPDMILARAETPSQWTETATRLGVAEANYYLYPPFFAMAIVPLSFLSYPAAHTLWYLANLAALAGSVVVWIMFRRRGPAEIALACLAFVLSWPSLFTFGAGQANFVVLLFLMGAFYLLRSGRDIPAGLMVAGAVAVKMTPALLFVWLVWRRRWTALISAGIALGALVLAGAAVTGWEAYGIYQGEMVPLLSRGCAHWINESLSAFFTRVVDGGDMFGWQLADPSMASKVLTTLTGLGLVGVALTGMGGFNRKEGALELEYWLLVVTTLFLSPISWTHHSVLSLIPFLVAAQWLAARDRLNLPMALLLAVAFTMTHVYIKPPGILDEGPLRVFASINLAGNLILWGILFWMIRVSRQSLSEREVA